METLEISKSLEHKGPEVGLANRRWLDALTKMTDGINWIDVFIEVAKNISWLDILLNLIKRSEESVTSSDNDDFYHSSSEYSE